MPHGAGRFSSRFATPSPPLPKSPSQGVHPFMAISRDRVNNNLHKVVISFEDDPEPLNVWIAPNMITPHFQRIVKHDTAQMQARRAKWEKDRQVYIDRGEDIPEHLADEDALDRE